MAAKDLTQLAKDLGDAVADLTRAAAGAEEASALLEAVLQGQTGDDAQLAAALLLLGDLVFDLRSAAAGPPERAPLCLAEIARKAESRLLAVQELAG